MVDNFQITLTIKNLRATKARMPELERSARKSPTGPFHTIGYLNGTITAALARLEAFAAANPEVME